MVFGRMGLGGSGWGGETTFLGFSDRSGLFGLELVAFLDLVIFAGDRTGVTCLYSALCKLVRSAR